MLYECMGTGATDIRLYALQCFLPRTPPVPSSPVNSNSFCRPLLCVHCCGIGRLSTLHTSWHVCSLSQLQFNLFVGDYFIEARFPSPDCRQPGGQNIYVCVCSPMYPAPKTMPNTQQKLHTQGLNEYINKRGKREDRKKGRREGRRGAERNERRQEEGRKN